MTRCNAEMPHDELNLFSIHGLQGMLWPHAFIGCDPMAALITGAAATNCIRCGFSIDNIKRGVGAFWALKGLMEIFFRHH